jgi:hypothetical protein
MDNKMKGKKGVKVQDLPAKKLSKTTDTAVKGGRPIVRRAL